jgi:hypothetical protein
MNKKEVEREWAGTHPVLLPVVCTLTMIGAYTLFVDIVLLFSVKGAPVQMSKYIVPLMFFVMMLIAAQVIRRKRKTAEQVAAPLPSEGAPSDGR